MRSVDDVIEIVIAARESVVAARVTGRQRCSLIVAISVLLASCGGSPSSPTGAADITLTQMSVTSRGRFAGFGPDYVACGTIHTAPGVTDEVRVREITVIISDAANRALLEWSEPATSFPNAVGAGMTGCFTSFSDPDPTHPVGATFLLQVAYTRAGGSSRVAEISGSVVVQSSRSVSGMP